MITRGIGPQMILFITRGLGFIKRITLRIVNLVAQRRLLTLIADHMSITLVARQQKTEMILPFKFVDLTAKRLDLNLVAEPHSRELKSK